MSDLVTILESGDLADIKIGGTGSEKSVATLEYVDDAVGDAGIFALTRLTADTVALTTSFTKIEFAPDLVFDTTNGGITYDAVNKRYILTTTGNYQVFASGCISGAATREATFTWYLNGADVAPSAQPIFAMLGPTKPVAVSDVTSLVVTQAMLDDTSGSNAGEVWLEVYAKIDTADSIDIEAARLSFNKV